MKNLWESIFESEIIKRAKDFSIAKHMGQFRKGDGRPYACHPKEVAEIVKKYKGQSKHIDELIAASYLHDTVEDTTTTIKELQDEFGVLVASLVEELTSDTKKIAVVGKKKYLAKKMSSMSSYALVIKLADRISNTADIVTMPIKFQKKYLRETMFILNKIKSSRKLSATHLKLIDVIERNLIKVIKPL